MMRPQSHPIETIAPAEVARRPSDFQGGRPHKLFRSIREQLFTLPDDCVVYPAHDYDGRMSSTIGEERLYNARIGGGVISGLLVGVGTRLGSGCTSGHGIVGVARFSKRSLAATATFLAAGIAAATVMDLLR
jgi:hypothetical protein